MISITSLSQTAWAQPKAVDPGAATGSGDPRSFAPKVNTKLLSPGALIRDCGNCPEMVVIPGGSFVMGSNVQERELARKAGLDEKFTSWEGPQHPVRIPTFAAGRQAVTRGQFSAFVDAAGYVTDAERGDGCWIRSDNTFRKSSDHNWRKVGFAQDDSHPVVCASWNDAKAYAKWLTEVSGETYRLLSEAEREYAARGGTQSAFWWGDSISSSQSNYDYSGSSYNGSLKNNPKGSTVPADSFNPNPYGLYNVHGNVWEWVEDCFHDTYEDAPAEGSAWTTNCQGSYRMLRGGSWFNFPGALRSAFRGWISPYSRSLSVNGFRVARNISSN